MITLCRLLAEAIIGGLITRRNRRSERRYLKRDPEVKTLPEKVNISQWHYSTDMRYDN